MHASAFDVQARHFLYFYRDYDSVGMQTRWSFSFLLRPSPHTVLVSKIDTAAAPPPPPQGFGAAGIWSGPSMPRHELISCANLTDGHVLWAPLRAAVWTSLVRFRFMAVSEAQKWWRNYSTSMIMKNRFPNQETHVDGSTQAEVHHIIPSIIDNKACFTQSKTIQLVYTSICQGCHIS